MKLRALVLPCLLSAGLLVPAAHAQRQGTFEFGLFARKNWFGESYGLANRAGGGARLGFYLLRHLELEANGAYTPTRLFPETSTAPFTTTSPSATMRRSSWAAATPTTSTSCAPAA